MTSPSSAVSRSSSLADLRYFVLLALRGFRRDRFLTISIMLTLGVGIAASMTVFSILHILSGDPIPEKSTRLFRPSIAGNNPVANNTQAQWYSLQESQDVLQQLRPPERGAMMAQGFAASIGVPGGSKHHGPQMVFTSASFFSLFNVPFRQGAPWNADADATGDHVAVLSRPIARELFGSGPALGKLVNVGGLTVRVVGVTDDWHPIPRFYDLSFGAYASSDNVYVPLKSIRDMNSEAFVAWNCGKADKDLEEGHHAALLGPGCTWISVWTEIFSPQEHQRLEAFLAKTLAQVKK